MPSILTTNEQISADLAKDAGDLAAYVTAAVHAMNRMTGRLLALDDATLTAWLQANSDRIGPMFAGHAANGATLNQLVAGIAQQTAIPQEFVNVRPVADKLAANRRTIDWTTLTVSTLPEPEPVVPQPEPQPEPEPAMPEPSV